jgi:hypothetical protein
VEVPVDSAGVDEPSCEGLRTYGVQTRRLRGEGSAREGLTLQLGPICRFLTSRGRVRYFPEGFPGIVMTATLVTPFQNLVNENLLQSKIY